MLVRRAVLKGLTQLTVAYMPSRTASVDGGLLDLHPSAGGLVRHRSFRAGRSLSHETAVSNQVGVIAPEWLAFALSEGE
jgi:hypothetical protein